MSVHVRGYDGFTLDFPGDYSWELSAFGSLSVFNETGEKVFEMAQGKWALVLQSSEVRTKKDED
jgi:hypothetical protein